MHRLAAPDMHIQSAQTALKRLLKAEQWISCVAFAVLITVIFADVLSRELTGSGMHWARQVGVYANIFIVMAGFGLASASGAHLRPRFADGWLPVSWNAALIRLQEGVMALFCLAFAAVAVQVVAETYSMQERSVVLRVVVWPFQVVIPAAFAVAAVRHAIYALRPQLRPTDEQAGSG